MKKLLFGLALLFVVGCSNAEAVEETTTQEVKEMQVYLGEGVFLVITNEPCTKFVDPRGESIQLNYAYALNSKTGEKITGCFTHYQDIIEIQLSDDHEENVFYSYKVNADNFKPRITL